MKSLFIWHLERWKKIAAVIPLLIGPQAAGAQVAAYLPATENVQGTYADLGSAGTAIATANTDDANSAPQPIGFSFAFGGAAFTDFVLNTNGLLRLGAAPPSTAAGFFTSAGGTSGGPLNSPDPADVNLLLPFNHDLVAGTAPAEYRVATTGAAPNRVCTVQWKNVRDKAGSLPVQYSNFSFQVKLYETSNFIEFVYGPVEAAAGIIEEKTAAIGLVGPGPARELLTVSKFSGQTWSAATFGAGFGFSSFSLRQLPNPGRTFRFGPPAPNDAAVVSIHSVGQLPLVVATPHTIRAVVRNLGANALANMAVTATVTGATAFTDTRVIPTLAVGAVVTVAFAPFTPAGPGTNTIRVAVGPDDRPGNNAAVFTQQANLTTFSYAEPGVGPTGRAGATTSRFTNIRFIVAIGFNTRTPRLVTAVAARLEDPNTVGKTLSAVVCTEAGGVVGRTAPYVVQAGDIGTTKTFAFAPAVPVAAGNVFAGINLDPNGILGYFPIGTQTEDVTRPGSFFRISASGTIFEDIQAENLGRLMIDVVTADPTVTATAPALAQTVALYPNPAARGQVTLTVQGAAGAGPLQVRVCNSLGQLVHRATAPNNSSNQLDLSALRAGVYMVHVQSGSRATALRLVLE